MCSLSTKQINPPSAIDNSVVTAAKQQQSPQEENLMFISAGLEAIRCVSKVSGKATVIAAIGVRYTKKYADGGYTISGHIYREGNICADKLVRFASSLNDFCWLNSAPIFIAVELNSGWGSVVFGVPT
ncbi:hypothetical protein D0Y65_054897 [Glycine soja]|uniref:RNase H type-1 domain-containing protein n=1 Tax=Glycine soja TaxID=3848 RepID=A0A445F8Z2_GLYSO|nr:hypothetical protein D0Y65_054897 [Glycine soja]